MDSNYKKAKYIQNASAAQIDTGVCPTVNTIIKMKFLLLDSNGNGSTILGFSNSDNDSWRLFRYSAAWYLDCGNANKRVSGGRFKINTIYYVEAGNNYLLNLDTGSYILSGSYNSFSDKTDTINLQSVAHIRVYSLQIYEGEELIRDFVPCVRKSDNIGGLYDKVNDVFYSSIYDDYQYEYDLVKNTITSVYKNGTTYPLLSLYANEYYPKQLYYNTNYYYTDNRGVLASSSGDDWELHWEYGYLPDSWHYTLSDNEFNIYNDSVSGDHKRTWGTKNTIDVTEYKKLIATIIVNSSDINTSQSVPLFRLGLNSTYGQEDPEEALRAEVRGPNLHPGEIYLEVDISNAEGAYYITFNCHSRNSLQTNLTIKDIKLTY